MHIVIIFIFMLCRNFKSYKPFVENGRYSELGLVESFHCIKRA